MNRSRASRTVFRPWYWQTATGRAWAGLLSPTFVLPWDVIDRSGRQIDQFLARRSYPGLTDLVREAYDGIGVGDVKATAEERHSEWRVQVLQERRSNFRNSVAIGVSKQRYAIGAGQAGSSGSDRTQLHRHLPGSPGPLSGSPLRASPLPWRYVRSGSALSSASARSDWARRSRFRAAWLCRRPR